MKKWTFWTAMCLAAAAHGACFFGASARAMQGGISGVDNQAALLLIPLLWIAAAVVIAALLAATLLLGIRLGREQVIDLFEIFQLSGLSAKARAGRIAFLIAACLLMALGYGLFAPEIVLSLAYALSGGLLLLFLYAWGRAALRTDGP